MFDARNLYVLRYRRGTTGVVTSYITATSKEAAEKVGKWFCGSSPNMRFIGVETAIVADETDLKYSSVEERDAAKAKGTAVAAPAPVATNGGEGTSGGGEGTPDPGSDKDKTKGTENKKKQ